MTAEQLSRAILCGMERHRLIASIREQSLTDELTDLYNRRGFLSLGARHLSSLSARAGGSFWSTPISTG